jgi:anti-sigma-K factor RskA
MSCKELVELVTDYLEGSLSWRQRRRFEKHLVLCHGCNAYVEQFRVTLSALGTLREEDVPPPARDELLAAFRDWKRA